MQLYRMSFLRRVTLGIILILIIALFVSLLIAAAATALNNGDFYRNLLDSTFAVGLALMILAAVFGSGVLEISSFLWKLGKKPMFKEEAGAVFWDVRFIATVVFFSLGAAFALASYVLAVLTL